MEKVLIMFQLFILFWSKKTLERIYRETNRYAMDDYEIEGETIECTIWTKGGKD